MPKFPTDPTALLPFPFVDREDGRIMGADPATVNDDIVDIPANLMAKWTGSALDYQDCSAAYTIVAGRPHIIINATGTAPYNITVPDSYTPAGGDVAAGIDRGGFQIELVNTTAGILTLVMDSGPTTISTPAVTAGAVGRWYYDANIDGFINVPVPAGGGSGIINITLGTEYDTLLRTGGDIIYGMVINMGAGPNTTTATVAHGITGLDRFVSGRIAASISGGTGYDLSYVNTATSEESCLPDATNMSWTTINDRTVFNGTAWMTYTKV